MGFEEFIGLVVAEFAKAFGKAVGEELGKELVALLSRGGMDNEKAYAELLKSIKGIVQQALDDHDVTDARGLIISGNNQVKEYRDSRSPTIGLNADKTFNDALGKLLSHPRTSMDVKATCSVGHVALALMLGDRETEKQPTNYKLYAVNVLKHYAELLRSDLAEVTADQVETLNRPGTWEVHRFSCRTDKQGFERCSLKYSTSWTVTSVANGSVPGYAGLGIGSTDDDDPVKKAKEAQVDVAFAQALANAQQGIDDRALERNLKVLEPVRKLIDQYEATATRLVNNGWG